MRDTIAAVASPPGPGARGIVRLSGPKARDLALAAWSGELPRLPARGLRAGRIDDGRGTQPVLLVVMSAPRSYTGEDVVELHLPGSTPLLRAAYERLLALGARAAEPGEFTRRAFLNGRIDLARAEGVLALVRAGDEAEARAARALLFGGLSARVNELRDALDDLRALCEASLDFDEQDTGHVDAREIEAQAAALVERVRTARDTETARSRASGSARVALCGAPNAGKSALYNALAGRDAAIVSSEPGTTRDALEAHLELASGEARLYDLPGDEPPRSELEREAQAEARARAASADLCLLVVDAAAPRAADRAREQAVRLRDLAPSIESGAALVIAWNKSDLPCAPPPPAGELGATAIVPVSAATGAGLDRLRAALAAALAPEEVAFRGHAPLEREVGLRHDQGLATAETELLRALEMLRSGSALELVAEHLRAATGGLDAILGRTTSEDLLDRIFARFCLGK